MKTEKEIRDLIASNIAFYRKSASLTQSELAEKINYSDKSVSKWERGEGLPDIYVLSLIAEACKVEADVFLKETPKTSIKPVINPKKQHIIVLLLSVGIALLAAVVASVCFSFLGLSKLDKYVWCMLPVAASVIFTVFSKLWLSNITTCIAVSLIVWSTSFGIFKCVPVNNSWSVFYVAAVLQIMVVLWFLLKYVRKNKT